MTVLRIFLAMLLACPTMAGAQLSLEEQLRKEYVDSEQMLRHFYAADNLKFDVSGNPLNHDKTGAWTLLGAVVIDKLTLRSDKLELQGHRTIVAFDDGGRRMKRIKWNEKVSIEVPTHSGADQAGQLRSALARVFVAPGDDLVKALPDYWQDYMARYFSEHADGEPCHALAPTVEAEAPQSTNPNSGTAQTPSAVKVSAGIVEGHLVRPVAPHYLPVARQAGVEGDVGLRALISKTGDVVKVCIAKALGAGMDDEAVNTVQQWKYSPYRLNGEPIEIKTNMALSFHMH